MKTNQIKTTWCRLYIAGDYKHIKQICGKFVNKIGLCVTVTKTDYIYTGGQEKGVIIELIDYPRFPKKFNGSTIIEQLKHLARAIAEEIIKECNQKSYTIMTSEDTTWYSYDKEVTNES